MNEFRDDEDETASDKSRLIHMKRFGHWLSQNVWLQRKLAFQWFVSLENYIARAEKRRIILGEMKSKRKTRLISCGTPIHKA